MVRILEGTLQRFPGPGSGLSLNTEIFFYQFQDLAQERSLKFDLFQNALWVEMKWEEKKCYLISQVSLRFWSEHESRDLLYISVK